VTVDFARHGGGECRGVPLDDIFFVIDGRELLGIVLLLAFLFVPIGISFMPYKGNPNKPPLFDQLQNRMGLGNINSGLLFIAIAFWALIFGSLLLGLLGVIWSFIMSPIPQEGQIWNWRFSLAKMAALTATLGAVVALPFTLIRLTFTRTQTETAVEALFNDKINAAVEDLHAQRQVSVSAINGETKTHETVWQDDVTRRNGAIDRLEGLVQENANSAERIARMLSVYVRELSKTVQPTPTPENAQQEELQRWVNGLQPKRSDMENAFQVLGRLKYADLLNPDTKTLDLQRANLQACMLNRYSFFKTDFSLADMSATFLANTDLRRCTFIGTQLEGSHLRNANCQGSQFIISQFGITTSLEGTNFRGAAMRSVDLTNVSIGAKQLNDLFGDASVILPGGHGPGHADWPEHWPEEKLDWGEFEDRWRAFQASIGQDPDNPT
jgi:uncharacterized protein YjbI with pentapeptide repeats